MTDELRDRCIAAAANDPAVVRAYNDDDPFDTLVMRIVDAVLAVEQAAPGFRKEYGTFSCGQLSDTPRPDRQPWHTSVRLVSEWQGIGDGDGSC